jgi:hypothetical protein
MMRYAFATLSTIVGFGMGRAHTSMRGSVAMKLSSDEAHVCLGDNEVKVGDKVNRFKNICESSARGKIDGNGAGCKKVKLGKGTILQTLNEHYSVMKVDSNVAFEEGTIVENNNEN